VAVMGADLQHALPMSHKGQYARALISHLHQAAIAVVKLIAQKTGDRIAEAFDRGEHFLFERDG
jgi:hypothetical protein